MFPLDSHQSCFICLLELLSEMCTIWASKAQFLGHFGPKIKSKLWTLVTFSKIFDYFHISINSHAHCKYFRRCVEYGHQRSNFGAILGPQISKNSGLWSFSQKVSTGSHQYCFTCSLQVFVDVWRIWSSEVMCLGHFGPQNQQKNPIFGHFLK